MSDIFATNNYHALAACIEEGVAFRTSGQIRGVPGIAWYIETEGHLSDEDAADYKQDGEHITYTILSYDTPIAWVLDDGTYVLIEDQVTQTTARHQNTARLALERWETM